MTITLYIAIGMFAVSLTINTWVLHQTRLELASLPGVVTSLPVTKLDVTEQPAAMFKRYLKDFKKQYDDSEMERRFGIFKKSLKEISRMNRESNATFGLTEFSDVTPEEVLGPASRLTPVPCMELYSPCGNGPINSSEIDFHRNRTFPHKFDWRNVKGQNLVGPVLNQKLCNGCWAFGIVGVMETMAARLRGEYGPRLSIQELIDCAADTEGCENGNVALALNRFCTHRWGVYTEAEYPLKLISQKCKYSEEELKQGGTKLKQFWRLCNVTGLDIVRLVHFHGPVTVVVNADPWLGYNNGIIQGACIRTSKTRDHVVQIVGYDISAEAEVPHFVVRNSWGEKFGEGGYLRLAIEGNVCGVQDEVAVLNVYDHPKPSLSHF